MKDINTIGIIGGGQLGRMTIPPAKALGLDVKILDKTPNSPAGQLASEQIVGNLSDPTKLKELASQSDLLTYEIEHIDVEPLKEMQQEGVIIFPTPEVLEVIQNKYTQKQALEKNQVPTSRFEKVESKEGLAKQISDKFSYPVVQKSCKGGYDGRGVYIIKSEEDIKNSLEGETFLEEYIPFEMEIAVNVARNKKGEISCHPVCEMVFNEEANICDTVLAPARVSKEVMEEAKKIGIKAIESLGSGAVGIFGVEMFLTKEGQIMVNEIAPRPHNSGHYTIEACKTSQYEQHIRAITNMELGSTELIKAAGMLNILGDDDECHHFFSNQKAIEAIPETFIHWYGKKEVRPMRKVGHITTMANTIEEVVEKLNQIRKLTYK